MNLSKRVQYSFREVNTLANFLAIFVFVFAGDYVIQQIKDILVWVGKYFT